MKISTLLLLLTFFLGFACTSKQTKKVEEPTVEAIEIVYQVEGMTCDHCEMSIQKGVNSLDGISKVIANHEDSTTTVVFNPSKTDKKQIAEAIAKRGYKVIE